MESDQVQGQQEKEVEPDQVQGHLEDVESNKVQGHFEEVESDQVQEHFEEVGSDQVQGNFEYEYWYIRVLWWLYQVQGQQE